MIDTTDLQEIEVSLPGDWLRTDNGDLYSFTVNKMEMKDDRLFRQLIIQHEARPDTRPDNKSPEKEKSALKEESLQYALMIKNDYIGVLIGETAFIIKAIEKREDGSAHMQWEDEQGGLIAFELKR